MDKEQYLEKAKALRADTETHYNCAQAALLALKPEGVDEGECARLTALFGSGMQCGAVCGAVTGALMALGLHNVESKAGQEFVRQFRQKNGAINCAELLKAMAERGETKKPHCDRMVCDAVELAAELLEQ